jgi:NAD(P)-dependent dehydrogenase (short-subunit alcohol dehydrogenase family)
MHVNNQTMTKRILITGATRGIGAAIAQKYKAQGHYVIGMGSQEQTTPEYLDEYSACDLSSNDALNREQDVILYQEIDVLVNCAGINIIDNFGDIKLADFQRVQQVNVVAPFRLCQMVLPHMAQQGWGRIVNISSVWGKISRQGRASYSASKFALDGMTVALANEYAAQGILANSVAPGFIDTEMTQRNLGPAGIAAMLATVPIGRLATVDEVAEFVYWLGSEQNTYISGQNLAIDGGFTRA